MFKLGRKGKITKVYIANCNECEGEDYVSSESTRFNRNEARNKFRQADWVNQGGLWYHLKCLLSKGNGRDG